MTVRVVDGREAVGTLLVLAVLEHAETAPVGPWAASERLGAVADGSGAVWFPQGDGVARLVPLGCRCECAELTTYRRGVETSRIVGPSS
ncbi:hypothetical protein ACGRHY_18930 [Streptomyces sp. HK10]|uniref:hypothetical protein n=1 Tax=Streptomyces sp. HK10 TaxID=3373255 RepID=UPI00374788FA